MHASDYDAPDDIMLDMIAKATLKNLEHKNNFDGSTILHRLASFGGSSVTQLRSVLEKTKNANVTDNLGRTPLHRCILAPRKYDEHRETVMCLLIHGASASIKDMHGRTPLDCYDCNKCREYENSTRSEKKHSLKKLLIGRSIPPEIEARGKTAVKAYEYEMQNGEMTVVNARFMFLGKEGAGKTSCVNHILEKDGILRVMLRSLELVKADFTTCNMRVHKKSAFI
ncbi:poly [ADP-ribose] polymerase tankyrase-2-like [Anneissia japonica]|uniref:poly [ADP-ribose] polymerase tankyrase-2-like n=1 Tax=Anneissia japonica TaxID=1529436 RepID=UPI00142550D5|nr:poly [ADP-ribose] polymerase tankyrase-2-like [Anneissia japonica]